MDPEKFAQVRRGYEAKKAAEAAEAEARYMAEKAARNVRLTEAARRAGSYWPAIPAAKEVRKELRELDPGE
jgi:hypothetical protein